MFKKANYDTLYVVTGEVSSHGKFTKSNGYFCIHFCDYDNQGNKTIFGMSVRSKDVNKLIVQYLLNSDKWIYLEKVIPITKYEYKMYKLIECSSRKHT